jgi:hypothetical protein
VFFVAEHQSYIHFPRIHFAGKFQADPSTINNYPDNFDTDNFPGQSKGWNPTGSATWRLVDTRITRVCYANKVCTSLETDDALNNKLLEGKCSQNLRKSQDPRSGIRYPSGEL